MPRKASGNTRKITLLITPAVHAELGRAAEDENTNCSDLLRRLIRQYMINREDQIQGRCKTEDHTLPGLAQSEEGKGLPVLEDMVMTFAQWQEFMDDYNRDFPQE